MNLEDKKILWLTDYTNKEVPAGGAEITDSYIINAGRYMGYDLEVCRPCDLRSPSVEKADLVIFSNCYEFKKPARRYIMQNKKYIAYSHDSGRWMDVLRAHPDMFKNSLMNIFLSPLHRDCFKKYLEQSSPVSCVPPHIPLQFYDKGHEKKNRIMFVGNIHDGKGIPSVIEYARENPETIIDFYFHRYSSNLKRQLKNIKNCNLVGFVPKEQIHENYSKYKYFIHIPHHREAFGRAVGEAFLSGCKLIVNDRVGATSYGWNYRDFRKNTAKAHFLFWKTIEDTINP